MESNKPFNCFATDNATNANHEQCCGIVYQTYNIRFIRKERHLFNNIYINLAKNPLLALEFSG